MPDRRFGPDKPQLKHSESKGNLSMGKPYDSSNNSINSLSDTNYFYELVRTEQVSEAYTSASKLAMLDSRYCNIPFALMHEEMLTCIQLNQYAIISMPFNDKQNNKQQTPVACLMWGMFNPVTLNIYAKGIRQLSPAEFKSGDDPWIVHLTAPFGDHERLRDFIKSSIPLLSNHQQLLTLDLFEKLSYSTINL